LLYYELPSLRYYIDIKAIKILSAKLQADTISFPIINSS